MKDILLNSKIIVCVGSGGVGKTTISATLGFLAAQQKKKVLVLTIDPSQRLKTTLNLSDDGEIHLVEQSDGQLYAGVINAKKTFDNFVRKAAKIDQLANQILKNKLYVQLSTTLSGSQEFTALEKLLSEYESRKYDLIILDTPPSKHAIDFLRAPQKLSVLFNESIARWFRNPQGERGHFLRGLFQAGTKQVLRVLEMLTGSEFMHQLADFFGHIQSWQGQLEERVSSVHRLLVQTQTHFFLVTSFDHAKLKEAEYFSREIKKDGYRLSAVIMNRSHPEWLDLRQAETTSDRSELALLYKKMKKYFQERNQLYAQFSNKMSSGSTVIQLPELDEDISNIAGILRLADIFQKELHP